MSDYIPRPDDQYGEFSENLHTKTSGAPASFGLSAADVTNETAAHTAWDTAYSAHVSAQTSAATAQQTKDTARGVLETIQRALVGQIQKRPATTDAQRTDLRITVPDNTPTAPINSIDTWPVATVDTSTSLRHRLDFRDSGTPNSRAKPDGVMLCEIWEYIGDTAPVDENAYVFLASETKTPHRNDFPAADARKTAFYRLRWKLKSGNYGPWSHVVSATIPA